MLPREDFIFTIGYDGPSAVVDKQAKRKYAKLSTRELAEKGLFRAAYSSAVYSGNQAEFQMVAETYRRLTGSSSGLSKDDGSNVDTTAMGRLFGVFPVDVKRAVMI